MAENNDPIGQAILDFAATKKSVDIIVSSDLCDDDVIESSYLLRTWNEMPDIERIAIQQCNGKILDVGAGAGIHSKELMNRGMAVEAIDISEGAVQYMNKNDIKARKINFLDIKDEQFDTLLFMMNGIGIAGNLANLESFLSHAKSLLTENGKIICDSTNIIYLYEEDDGSMWLDLNAEYYGNFNFQMTYKNHETPWFDWLYIDFDKLTEVGKKVGLQTTLLYEYEHQFLVEMKHIE